MNIRTTDEPMDLRRVSFVATSLGTEEITRPPDRRLRKHQIYGEWSDAIAKSMRVNESG